jgi:hypothetical protein
VNRQNGGERNSRNIFESPAVLERKAAKFPIPTVTNDVPDIRPIFCASVNVPVEVSPMIALAGQ